MSTPNPPQGWRPADLEREENMRVQLGRATTLACAMVEIRRLAAIFGDDVLDDRLAWIEGRFLDRTINARKQLDEIARKIVESASGR